MSERFIKYIPGPKADWLLQKHPTAFLLLTLIANRARIFEGHPDGLKFGECFIGDYKSCGLRTRGQYRQALLILTRENIIEIIATTKVRQNSAIGTTIIGTKVRLINSDIYDINYFLNNHSNNHRTTIEQPQTKKDKKDKKEKKESKDSKKRNPGEQGSVASAAAERLVNEFLFSIRTFKPDFREPNLKVWIAEMDKILRLDGRAPEKISEVLKWLSTSEFWRKNVLSPSKLRQQFDRLELAMQSTSNDDWERINTKFFTAMKTQYSKELSHVRKSGNFVMNTTNSKELHLRMNPEAFVRAFAQVAGIEYDD